MDTEHLVVLVTAPTKKVGEQIAQTLVSEQLAACANLLPEITSIYAWEGKICNDPEVLLIIKTKKACFDRLAASIQSIHPYEVPEIIALPIVAGANSYLDWINSVTRPV